VEVPVYRVITPKMFPAIKLNNNHITSKGFILIVNIVPKEIRLIKKRKADMHSYYSWNEGHN
jgi:hypothetical protein